MLFQFSANSKQTLQIPETLDKTKSINSQEMVKEGSVRIGIYILTNYILTNSTVGNYFPLLSCVKCLSVL